MTKPADSRRVLDDQIWAILDSWVECEALTKETAFETLTDNFVSGYTDDDTDEEVEFDLEDMEWEEAVIDLDDLSAEALADLERLRQLWPTCEISAVEWTAGIELCGDLSRGCIRILLRKPEPNEWYAQPPNWDDTFTDRTPGPMWEGS